MSCFVDDRVNYQVTTYIPLLILHCYKHNIYRTCPIISCGCIFFTLFHCQISDIFHKNFPLHDFSIMTLICSAYHQCLCFHIELQQKCTKIKQKLKELIYSSKCWLYHVVQVPSAVFFYEKLWFKFQEIPVKHKPIC